MANVLGVVLAGGSGRRMAEGGTKALIRLGGRTLIARAISTLREICDDVVVSMSPLRPLPPAELAGARAVFDSPGSEGALAAMVSALGSEPFDTAFVLGVDLPLVPSSSLARLATLRGERRAVLATPHGMPQPFAAAYAFSALAPLSSCVRAGERAAIPAVLSLDPRLVSDPVLATWPGALDAWLNVNTPADVITAERLWLRANEGRAA